MTEGILKKNVWRRWEILDHDGNKDELSSGSKIEVKIGDIWIMTRLESAGGDYYSVVRGILLYEGMPARIPS